MPCSFGSTVSGSEPWCQCWRTQSTNIFRPWCALLLIGHRPQVTSRRNVPKANTSVRGDAFPVRASSGAMNPMVPTSVVNRLSPTGDFKNKHAKGKYIGKGSCFASSC
uniref:Uncharacterized protein n=1 Tax=Oryza nivara TaxID=4536 RepID=A0A0E0HWB1_ORYNI